MRVVSNRPGIVLLAAMLALPAAGGLSAQEQEQAVPNPNMIVNAPVYAKGPDIKGIITANNGEKLKVATAGGGSNIIAITDRTKIKGGTSRAALTASSLLNGLPVTIKTVQWSGGLVAAQINLKTRDFKTAAMIHTGTDERFEQQAAATDALKGRMGDIDKYNVKATTNVNFDTGKSELSAQAKAELCQAAATAEATDNALLLVVGYTDSVGSEEYNQQLSEKRASRVINYLQQTCHWKPYRMLVPTGMAEADPVAPNDTDEGKAQNRRVAVNVLVSKSVEGL
jgi:OOP family OmpA-OmpF porin